MPERDYQHYLSRHLMAEGRGTVKMLLHGHAPDGLVDACTHKLDASVVPVESVDSCQIGQVSIILDASAASTEERIKQFRSGVAVMPAGGRYIVYTGGADSAISEGALRRYFCDCLDELHGYHKRGRKRDGFGVTTLTERVHSINFYPELVVIEITDRERPEMLNAGEPQF